MGVHLIREVLDRAPEALTSPQRLVLVVLAETANDHSREGWPSMEVLTRRTGLAASRVRKILSELSEAGVVTRQAVGTDRAGAPVYAHRGHATVYRIAGLRPTEKAPEDEPLSDHPKAPENERLNGHGRRSGTSAMSGEKGAQLGRERRSSSRERRSGMSALPSVPSGTVRSARAPDETTAVIRALHTRTGKTIDEDHAQAVVRQLLDGRAGIRDRCAYLVGAIERDTAPERFLPTPTPPPFRAGAR